MGVTYVSQIANNVGNVPGASNGGVACHEWSANDCPYNHSLQAYVCANEPYRGTDGNGRANSDSCTDGRADRGSDISTDGCAGGGERGWFLPEGPRDFHAEDTGGGSGRGSPGFRGGGHS